MKKSDSRGILLIAESTKYYVMAQYMLRRDDGSFYHAL
jgi:hypothetical protein